LSDIPDVEQEGAEQNGDSDINTNQLELLKVFSEMSPYAGTFDNAEQNVSKLYDCLIVSIFGFKYSAPPL